MGWTDPAPFLRGTAWLDGNRPVRADPDDLERLPWDIAERAALPIGVRVEFTASPGTRAVQLRYRADVPEPGDPLADYRRQDTLLHLTLAELSGSPTLTAQYAAVRATVNDLLDCIPLLVRNLEHSQHQHTALVEAVLDGDADAAREVMREHCAGTAALLRGFLT